jgi:CPA2 family monovalent cation:H+ antiporter-2
LAVGLGLFQIGEFSFVLARVGLSTDSIGNDLYSLVLTATIISMVLTPLISGQTAKIYSIKKRLFHHERLETSNIPDRGYQGHVIIAGGGRLGFQIAEILERLKIQFIIIELDYRRFKQAQKVGMSSVFGNASQEIVLEAAGIKNAVLLILSIPDLVSTRATIVTSKRLNGNLKIVARVSGPDYFDTMKSLGVSDIVLPEFEASLEMTRQSLLHLRLPPTEVQRQTDIIRQELYSELFHSNESYRMLSQLRGAEQQFDLQWIRLYEQSPMSKKSIGECEIRKTTGVSVVGVVRNGRLEPNPDANFILMPDDLVAIIGNDKSRKTFCLKAQTPTKNEKHD